MTPFFDLLDTSIHVPGESDLALELFKDGFVTESFKVGSKHTKSDFEEFAERIGINKKRYTGLFLGFLDKSDRVRDIVTRSFLNQEIKDLYFDHYENKLQRLAS